MRLLYIFRKNGGHLRTVFATSGYSFPEVVNIFVNISTKTEIFWDVDLGPLYYRFMKKTRAQNSHATITLSHFYKFFLHTYGIM